MRSAHVEHDALPPMPWDGDCDRDDRLPLMIASQLGHLGDVLLRDPDLPSPDAVTMLI
jgi:hypothetical protein